MGFTGAVKGHTGKELTSNVCLPNTCVTRGLAMAANVKGGKGASYLNQPPDQRQEMLVTSQGGSPTRWHRFLNRTGEIERAGCGRDQGVHWRLAEERRTRISKGRRVERGFGNLEGSPVSS
eukprot:CAMPEP_0184327546 /NCGR_PEP_ID=MMETSP1049-20130417/143151_1 /TAXON_ID=77928 /ORGANISM="Proteomonas sulcata, Strain CCMP704" /LENGTH=120 /DNA_ID=CAMNT_0026649807 /DNA_START=765 /DNA_END=1124 /DNA_ORIENTATION=-